MEEKWIAKLENISLRYDKKEPSILEDFSLRIGLWKNHLLAGIRRFFTSG